MRARHLALPLSLVLVPVSALPTAVFAVACDSSDADTSASAAGSAGAGANAGAAGQAGNAGAAGAAGSAGAAGTAGSAGAAGESGSAGAAGTAGGAGTSGSSCPAPPTNLIEHTGETAVGTVETWKAADGIHVVNNGLPRTIRGTLVIEPCAQVRLGAGLSLNVTETGSLRVGSTEGGTVTIDALDASAPWGSLATVYPGVRFEIAHTILRNGGVSDSTSNGVIAMRGDGEAGKQASTQLFASNVTIEGSTSYGIELTGNAGFDLKSGPVTISGAKLGPVFVSAVAAGSVPQGTYTGNTRDLLVIDPQRAIVDTDTTWIDRGVPFGVGTGDLTIGKIGGTAALTLTEGVTVQMTEKGSSRVYVGRNVNETTPSGALLVDGKMDKPVSFRGNGSAGDWAGVAFTGKLDDRSHLNFAVVEDTGAFDGMTGSECVDGLATSDSSLDVGSGAVRFFLSDHESANVRADFAQHVTLRRSRTNGFLPDFFPAGAGGLDLCATNTFEDIALCNQTPFRTAAFQCPSSPVTCQCP